ncbi:nSTAND3 domain-containing NTPase [Nocardia cyriacigeorgica]|uniref:nSTAND3 domain-containing NTPase n=1 Tax=Nocardia cyriacigeorgica TaxID=135487 RepID=UPI0018954E65|nr:restriction endonuclease [Nocardia cyriacigeorgica]MBF6088269.1 restriction endonuclease [Nocardia cyriacigeorgica]
MPQYDFSTLSSTDFEQLMRDVWNAAEGLGLQCFPEGRDGGIDLREVRADGWTIVGQCKHYRRSTRTALLRAAQEETQKHGYQVADDYLFATTFPVTASLIDEIASVLEIPSKNVWGPNRINQALQDHPEIEKNNFKLWFPSTTLMEHFIHAGIHNRTRALLERVPDETKCWVQTPEFPAAREILERESVCIITGPPGAGKSCLASRLVLDAIDDGWAIICMSEGPRDAWNLCHPTAKQLFYFDDFLGETKLMPWAVDQAPDLRNFIAHVRRNPDTKRLIMTSRQQIVQQAVHAASDSLNELDRDPFLCTVTLDDLDLTTKIDILISHLTLSALSDTERDLARTDRRITRLAAHHSYNPRLISEVTKRLSGTDTADEALKNLQATFANPVLAWQTSYRSLSAAAQRTLLTLATLRPRPVELRSLRELAELMGNSAEWKATLKSVEPTWIRVVDSHTEKAATFANSSCRDYLIGLLDDEDCAEDYIDQIGRLEQLVNLAQEAGVIQTARTGIPAAERGHLALALMRNSRALTSKIEVWTNEETSSATTSVATLNVYCDCVRALSALGPPTKIDWLLEHIRELLKAAENGLPVHESFALAAQLSDLCTMPEECSAIAEKLIESGLRTTATASDLRAYEALREDLRTAALEQIAHRRAEHVFREEWELLLSQPGDPHEAIEEGRALQAQAQWYGIELNLPELIDTLPQEESLNPESSW